jgi:hypothetical protein
VLKLILDWSGNKQARLTVPKRKNRSNGAVDNLIGILKTCIEFFYTGFLLGKFI